MARHRENMWRFLQGVSPPVKKKKMKHWNNKPDMKKREKNVLFLHCGKPTGRG